MSDLAVVILTFNEANHVARAIDSVKQVANEIFVVDSYSKDDTVNIASSHGAIVLKNSFINYARQFQWALDNAPITSTWIMRLDADEVIAPDLRDELRAKLPTLPDRVVGINLKRKHIFFGRWIKHGGRYPLILLRIWRRGYGRIENRWMDEHILVSGGDTIMLNGGFEDHNLNDLTFFIEKHNKYATREAIDILNQKYKFLYSDTIQSASENSWQASTRRFIKETIYNRLPFQLSAVAYFLFRYIFQLGFLDGVPGIIYHGLQGLWYRFLVGAKVYELERALLHTDNPSRVREQLAALTGLRLD